MTATVALSVEVDAPVERTWAAATDWARQGEWMLGTTVTGDGAGRLTVRGPLVSGDARAGDSIAVDGVCLTVVDVAGDLFTVDVMGETPQHQYQVLRNRSKRLAEVLAGVDVAAHVWIGVSVESALKPAGTATLG